MHWLMDGCDTPAGPLPRPQERDGSAPGAEETPERRLAAMVQRVLELEEELREIDRLPDLIGAPFDATGELVDLRTWPGRRERALQLEAEMEQLRQEIAAADAGPHRDRPRAAEEIGERLVEQFRDRRMANGKEWKLLEDEPPADPAGFGADLRN